MRDFVKLGLYVRTLRHLKLVQVTNRVRRRFFRPRSDLSPSPDRRALSALKILWITREDSILASTRFRFLSQTRDLVFPQGWNTSEAPRLWLYNLHYFEGLLCQETDPDLKATMVAQWTEDNPPGNGSGWEPYPTSLRIVNWIKWSLSGGVLSQTAIHSMVVQIRYLSGSMEFHLLGNHLFANAKSLIFAGCFFAGRESDKWLAKGLGILEKQIPEQFLADGGHFELSTTYHNLLTEDLLDIIHMLRLGGQPVPQNWNSVVGKALAWMNIMTRPDGLPPLFNDAAHGVAPTPTAINTYANALGFASANSITPGLTDLPDSGYFRFEGDGYSMFGDAGAIGPDYIPGHAHCDIGNFEISVGGLPVIVDTGTSTYEAGARRNEERATRAHNVVQIEDMEQTEIWSSFRVGRRARVTSRTRGKNSVGVTHNGFTSVGVVTQRYFEMTMRSVTIYDSLTGSNRTAVARFHFHPYIHPRIEGDRVTAGPLTLTFGGALDLVFRDYAYAEEFNRCIPAQCLEVSFDSTVTTRITL